MSAASLASAGAGPAALPEGGRVDFTRLREQRRQRLLAAMADHRLDALVLGRPADIAYTSGARQLWTAGARPFSPSCVVLGATGAIHLLSTWDEGVPTEIGHESLYGLSWNPARLLANLRAIPDTAALRRVGTDGWSPGSAGLFQEWLPGAEVVDGGPALLQARSVKTADELACLVTAAAAAEAGLAAMVAALEPGVTERQLLAVHAGTIAGLGLPTPPTEAVATATPLHGPVARRYLATERPAAEGELVLLTGAALYAGYEATVGRTWLVGRAPADGRQTAVAARARHRARGPGGRLPSRSHRRRAESGRGRPCGCGWPGADGLGRGPGHGATAHRRRPRRIGPPVDRHGPGRSGLGRRGGGRRGVGVRPRPGRSGRPRTVDSLRPVSGADGRCRLSRPRRLGICLRRETPALARSDEEFDGRPTGGRSELFIIRK